MTSARSDLASSGSSSTPPSASRMTARLVSTSKPASGCEMSLATMRSSRLRAQLVGRVLDAGRRSRPRSRRAPGPARLSRPSVDEEVVGGLEHDLGDALVLLELAVGGCLGPEVGDRRRHHDDVGVGGPAEHRVLHLGSAVSTGTISTPGGAGRPMVVTSVTSAPRAGGGLGDRVALLARRAVADEAHRVDRLAGAAGGDQHPRPRRGRRRRREHARRPRRRCRRDRRGGPRPTSPPARRPTRGRPRAHPARAAWRGSPGPPGAPTSRCAWPAPRAPAHGWRAAWR